MSCKITHFHEFNLILRDFLNENPNNDIAKLWEQRRWKDLEEIKNMLLEMEKEIEKC